MAIDTIAAASGSQSAQQYNAPQTDENVSPGVSAYATDMGSVVQVRINDRWQPVSGQDAPELRGVPLSSLEEWSKGIDNAWHVHNDPRRDAAPDLDNAGHLALSHNGKYMPVLAIDYEPMKVGDRVSKLAAVTPGLHEFTVLDGSQLVVVERTVPEPLAAQIAPFLPGEDHDADVEGYVGRFPLSASSGVLKEADIFKFKEVGDAAVSVLAAMMKSPNHDAWKEQFVPLIGQIRDHQKVAVPRPLVNAVVTKLAELSPDYVDRHGLKRTEAAVRQFMQGAARWAFIHAGKYLGDMADQISGS